MFGFLGANGAGEDDDDPAAARSACRPAAARRCWASTAHRDSLNARLRIGYLPGELPIYRDLNAAEYLIYLSRLDSRPVAPDFLRYLLRRFDVSDVDEKRPLREQSHGMKQQYN